MIKYVVENLKELFTVQTEPDEDASVIDMDDLSRASGLLLHSTGARSRLVCTTAIPCICEKVYTRAIPLILLTCYWAL